ncbi:hypothetical protein K1719_033721 [Acacia pycnantha]|nr:hypothetical protein K1719_033721 [Acacia pycnantha]
MATIGHNNINAKLVLLGDMVARKSSIVLRFVKGQFLEFQTDEECEYLINLAEPHMQKSTVLDLDTGKIKYSRVSTCSETFLPRGRDKIVRNIEKRIADFTSILVDGLFFMRGTGESGEDRTARMERLGGPIGGRWIYRQKDRSDEDYGGEESEGGGPLHKGGYHGIQDHDLQKAKELYAVEKKFIVPVRHMMSVEGERIT